MLNSYLAPGDVMQMYEDNKISTNEGIGHLTQHLFNESHYSNGNIERIEDKISNLYSAFNSGCITGEEYLNDLYRLTLTD